MQNFQQILTEAAQLKQHQLKKDRQGYQSLPQFIKSGLGYNKRYNIVRKQDFNYQYRISNKVKQQGNKLFKEEKIEQALSKYQEALSIFRYIESKSYQNMKDEDLQYHNYDPINLTPKLKQKYETHLCALYLNICSCLTKLNKKQDALYSADEALKIKKTVKAHYKKAQVYLKYVNRDANDLKLGLLELKEAYMIDKSKQILKQMHLAKQNYEKQQQKSKNWFKFMFDKNKNMPQQRKQQKQLIKSDDKRVQKTQQNPQKQEVNRKMLQLDKGVTVSSQKQKLEQAKQKLKIFTEMAQQQWQYNYTKDYIRRHGSKIYSMLKVYKEDELAAEFRSFLAKSMQKQEQKQKSIKNNQNCINWLRMHPLQKITKYIERYDLQMKWIKQNRNTKVQQKGKEEQANIKVEQEEVKQLKKQENNGTENTIGQQGKDMQFVKQQVEQQEKQQSREKEKDKKQRYITIAVMLFLILLRFLYL